ncbi:MAG: aldehyde ferredoxin oxidoreductase N-terminal domain-containing protein, partial [Candidatus Bipolaricaulia bacterium]
MAAPQGYRVIAEMSYERARAQRGYTGKTLYVNVGSGAIEERPVTQEMKDIFIGGRGFGLWRLWNAVDPSTTWDDPRNEIVISSGPIGG